MCKDVEYIDMKNKIISSLRIVLPAGRDFLFDPAITKVEDIYAFEQIKAPHICCIWEQLRVCWGVCTLLIYGHARYYQ